MNYKGFKINKNNGWYYVINEHQEEECECFTLEEAKQIIDDRIKYGYWCY